MVLTAAGIILMLFTAVCFPEDGLKAGENAGIGGVRCIKCDAT
jgi:hypothetical protein